MYCTTVEIAWEFPRVLFTNIQSTVYKYPEYCLQTSRVLLQVIYVTAVVTFRLMYRVVQKM